MLDVLSQDVFKENLHTPFKIQVDDKFSMDLQLVECNDLGSTDVQEQFSLIFQGDGQQYLNQMIYTLVHEKLGDLSLFLVPVHKNANGFQYEAVINRFRESR
jgi:hypothetical protein